jgi:arylsulfatase A
MFTADNGTGGEGKATPTELGSRVPMIVNCPGTVQPVGLSHALVDTSDVMPTLVEMSGAKLPAGHPIDGRSFAPILRGEKSDVRDWVFSYLGDRRVLRTKRYLLENNHPDDFGTLYDCGDSRDGTGYVDVTNSDAPEVRQVKQQFEQILATKPVPKAADAEAEAPKKGQKKKAKKKAANL